MSETQKSSWIIEVRNRLSTPPARRLAPEGGQQAAVLILLYVDAGELWTMLTQRAEPPDLEAAAAEPYDAPVAFTGGPLEPGEDPWDAAVRRTEKALGIPSQKILRLGDLDEIEMANGLRVTPCVGAVPSPIETELDKEEIDDKFVLPIRAFANPTAVEDRAVTVGGEERMWRIYHVGNRQIYGVVALMLQNLMQRLGLESAAPPN